MLNWMPSTAAPSRDLKAGSPVKILGQGSLRFGFDPRVTYRTIFREHGIDIVPCVDIAPRMAHFLGNEEHIGRPIGMASHR